MILPRLWTYQELNHTGFAGAKADTWKLPTRDRAPPPSIQRRSMAALGGVPDVHTSATGHEVMITAPRELAGFLLSVLD